MTKIRKNSFAVCGGVYGDEGKGRVVDMFVSKYASKGLKVVVYRDNGGSNAGHTVEFKDGKRVALHQLPSGVFVDNSVVILGKDMVLHPGDLVEEINQARAAVGGKLKSKILIDEMATLVLDTHRAFEAVLKNWQSGSKGATGRGIAPAYADVLLRHPLKMKDLIRMSTKKIKQHYELYDSLIKGLGEEMKKIEVPTLEGKKQRVGSFDKFLQRLKGQTKFFKAYIGDAYGFMSKTWGDKKYAFVFEKAQAIGLDKRWGVYPDVTASDTTLAGIYASTEGIVDPDEIEVKAEVIKATYMSSVGIRKLPTLMRGKLADRIREDAHEYGATTKRPRDVAFIDIPTLKFFAKVGKANYVVLTHMDISYIEEPLKVCVEYKIGRMVVSYRPDQNYLDMVTPVYKLLPSWKGDETRKAKKIDQLPKEAQSYLKFIAKELNLPVLMVTTGPKRDQGFVLNKNTK
jgi:adenylosuccinate synthase